MFHARQLQIISILLTISNKKLQKLNNNLIIANKLILGKIPNSIIKLHPTIPFNLPLNNLKFPLALFKIQASICIVIGLFFKTEFVGDMVGIVLGLLGDQIVVGGVFALLLVVAQDVPLAATRVA